MSENIKKNVEELLNNGEKALEEVAELVAKDIVDNIGEFQKESKVAEHNVAEAFKVIKKYNENTQKLFEEKTSGFAQRSSSSREH